MKKIFKLIFGIVFIIFIVSCGDKGVKKEEDPNLPKHSVEINIKCDGNLFFSKYDVDVYIDDEKVVTIKHGENYVDIVKLTEGKHALIFKKKDDKSVEGKVEFLVKEDTKLNYQIHCNSDKVTIKELAGEKKEEVQESKENEDSNESDINEKNNESLEATFPKENAKRAIVVSLTNAYSSDVFKKDGNTYDLKKFHSYAEVSEFNLKIEKDGEWTAKDDKTWHIDNIELKSATKIYIKASLDVIFNGENYIISNISGLMGAKNISDDKKINISDIEQGKCPYLTVSPELIKEDRNSEDFKDLDENKIASDARKIFQAYGKSLFPYGFKCHWVIGKIAEEVSRDGSCFLKVEVTIKNEYGAKRKAIAEGTVKDGKIIDFHIH
ncbi:YPYG domain-containing protein [Parvimonas micra]|mgnify:CR=1 FL=1